MITGFVASRTFAFKSTRSPINLNVSCCSLADAVANKPAARKRERAREREERFRRLSESSSAVSQQRGGCTKTPRRFSHSPLYSMPHFSFTITGFPVSSFKNGFGFTGVAIVCYAVLAAI